MRRSPVLLIAALAAALPAAPAAAKAPTRVISAYADYVPANRTMRDEQRGTVHLFFRTTRRLGEREPGRPWLGIDPAGLTPYTVSGRLNCYEAVLDVPLRGRGSRLGPGRRIHVRIGRGGRLLERSLTILRRHRGWGRGGQIGCGQDPEANYLLFNLFRSPLRKPHDFFFTANSGPYVTDLRWSGWGTGRAVGHGRFVSDCASCGAPVHRPTVIVLDRSSGCPQWGARAYRGRARVYDTQTGPGRWVRIGVSDLYC